MSAVPTRGKASGAPGWLLLAGVAAVLVAGIVHLAAVLILSQQGGSNAFLKVEALGHGVRLHTFAGSPDGDTIFPFRDPAMAEAFCLFDLGSGPVDVALPVTTLDVATLSVHDRHGQSVTVLTNRSAVNGALALSVMTPAMLAAGEASSRDDGRLRVALDGTRGFVMVQALAAMPSLRPTAEATIGRLSCRAGSPG